MKTLISFIIATLMLFGTTSLLSEEIAEKGNSSMHPGIQVASSPELQSLASNWITDFNKLNKNSNISLTELNGSEINSDLVLTSSLSVISNASWTMVVGREIIVPVMSISNPEKENFLKSGITADMISKINGTGSQSAIKLIYVLNDETVIKHVESFLNLKTLPEGIFKISSKDDIQVAIQSDPTAIAFVGYNTFVTMNSVILVPIDRNSNGKIDHFEDIYSDAISFSRGVWIGKFPKELFSNIYLASKTQPVNETSISFIKWITSNGQVTLNSIGITGIAANEADLQMAKLIPNDVVLSENTDKNSVVSLIILVIAGAFILSIIGLAIRGRLRGRKNPYAKGLFTPISIFDENSVKIPKGLYYDKTHTWAFREKDGNISIGIDDFIQHVTGQITKIDMKNPGDKIKKGELLLSINQSGKHLNIYSPVSGTIISQNESLLEHTESLNSSPYNDGWVYKIEPDSWYHEAQLLLIPERYQSWIHLEFSRLKDFLASSLSTNNPEYAQVVLQDGGTLKEGVLTDFGPKTWEDFQNKFLDIQNY